jgi:hypothetical protein
MSQGQWSAPSASDVVSMFQLIPKKTPYVVSTATQAQGQTTPDVQPG